MGWFQHWLGQQKNFDIVPYLLPSKLFFSEFAKFLHSSSTKEVRGRVATMLYYYFFSFFFLILQSTPSPATPVPGAAPVRVLRRLRLSRRVRLRPPALLLVLLPGALAGADDDGRGRSNHGAEQPSKSVSPTKHAVWLHVASQPILVCRHFLTSGSWSWGGGRRLGCPKVFISLIYRL